MWKKWLISYIITILVISVICGSVADYSTELDSQLNVCDRAFQMWCQTDPLSWRVRNFPIQYNPIVLGLQYCRSEMIQFFVSYRSSLFIPILSTNLTISSDKIIIMIILQYKNINDWKIIVIVLIGKYFLPIQSILRLKFSCIFPFLDKSDQSTCRFSVKGKVISKFNSSHSKIQKDLSHFLFDYLNSQRY